MLTWTFLGIGNAFAKRNFQSNALVEVWAGTPGGQSEPDDTLLVDFGTAGPQALYRLMDQPGFRYLQRAGDVHYQKLRRVFVTHLHGDHIGGLEELALVNAFGQAGAGEGHRPELISSGDILERLWEHSLRGGLGVMQGEVKRLEDYFVPRPVGPGPADDPCYVLADRYELRPFETDHIRLSEKYDWPSLGLLLRDAGSGESVFFSGDTGFDPDSYGPMMADARLCFHEVHLADEDLQVHTTLRQLRTLPESIRRKTYLYHVSDDWDADAYKVVDEEFGGFARPSHRYVLFE
jgi:ribonuclease BN (tRNA processing enzyme)